jgi:adenosylcobinamide-phosphate synthase
MSFFSILAALLLEQVRPMKQGGWWQRLMQRWMIWAVRNIDAGQAAQAWLLWLVVAIVPTISVVVIYWTLWFSSWWLLALFFNIFILYLTLGFRQFSHHFTGIRDALDVGDETLARHLLSEWRHMDASHLPRSEILRLVIEESVLAAHRHVFGVLIWFSLMALIGLGPAGALFYRLTDWATHAWPRWVDEKKLPISPAVVKTAAQAWQAVDWLPARATALTFAVVGNFEEAIYSWRHEAERYDFNNQSIIMAATAGALGASLQPLSPAISGEDDALSPMEHPPEFAHLRSVVGLVWRSVVMWMVLIALLTLARLLG